MFKGCHCHIFYETFKLTALERALDKLMAFSFLEL